MREFEVHFVSKAAAPSGLSEKVVSEIGNPNWRMKRDAALGWIKVDANTFFVKVGEQKKYLVVAEHNGQSWLRTSTDWSQPNELLTLPDFPAGHGK
jgi:hypothetical protein